MWRQAAAGLVIGAGWGVAARVWMRLISTDPGFSWSGTLGIITFAALAGLGLGLVSGARACGRRSLWRLAALLAFPIVAAPQGIVAFLPAFVLGGLAFSDRLSPRWRTTLLAVAAAMPVLMWFAILGPDERASMPFATFVVGLAALSAGLAGGGSLLLRRWQPAQPLAAWQDAGHDPRADAGPGPADSPCSTRLL